MLNLIGDPGGDSDRGLDIEYKEYIKAPRLGRNMRMLFTARSQRFLFVAFFLFSLLVGSVAVDNKLVIQKGSLSFLHFKRL